jgi:hypothetical protein
VPQGLKADSFSTAYAALKGRSFTVRPPLLSPLSSMAVSGPQQMPGFFVRFVFLVGAAGGEEEVAAEDGDDFGGEDIPDVFGDDVDGEEVDLVAGVIVVAGLDRDDVSAVLAGDGGFDLDAEKASAALDGEVVAGGVSPGFGDVESALGDAGHEIEFGPLAAMFGVFDDDAAAAVGWEDFVGNEFV